MKLPLSWVSLYSDIAPLLSTHTPKSLAHEYSIHTAEIDTIEVCDIPRVIIGRVKSCEKHPDSKKLSIVEVEITQTGETTTILTGAENIVHAHYVPVALVGCTLPGDFTISERKMAGMISRGMICSIDELGLSSERAEGILILEEIWDETTLDSMVGQSFFDLSIEMPGLHGARYSTPLRDVVFEIDNKFITNRPDLFSVAGNAREFHAVFETEFRPYTSRVELEGVVGKIEQEALILSSSSPHPHPLPEGDGDKALTLALSQREREPDNEVRISVLDSGSHLPLGEGQGVRAGAENKASLDGSLSISDYHLSIETPLVSSYHMLVMRGVEISESPFGLSVMLHRADMSVKMDIVDITNAIMTELGQPLHAFDADRVVGGIVVRMARAGETLLALSGVEITLDPSDIVIADHEKVLALAGVIGGMESAVSRETRTIIWESACFDPAAVRLSAQRHGIRTDASTRYEKSLDPLLAESGITRVIEYMDFLQKSYQITQYESHLDTHSVRLIRLHVTREQIIEKLGVTIDVDTFEGILSRLGFHYQHRILDPSARELTFQYLVTVPSWRATKDIDIWEDIAEEVGRVSGYDHITEQLIPSDFGISAPDPRLALRNQTLTHWSHRGWIEGYHYSFSSESLDRQIGYVDMESAIRVENAFNEEYTHMRRSLIPRLLLSVAENVKHTERFSLFELGQVFEKSVIGGQDYRMTGEKQIASPFSQYHMLAGVTTEKSLDSVKSDIESYLLSTIGFVPPIRQGSPLLSLHPGVSGVYHLDDTIIAHFGRVHPSVAAAFAVPPETIITEIVYPEIHDRQADREVLFHEISRFPVRDRELNFILEERQTVGPVLSFLDSLHPWIGSVRVASIYRDEERVGREKKSVTIAFSLSSPDATISDPEALDIQNMIIDRMAGEGWHLKG